MLKWDGVMIFIVIWMSFEKSDYKLDIEGYVILFYIYDLFRIVKCIEILGSWLFNWYESFI